MKIFKFSVLLIILITLASCTEVGEQGPKGEPGIQGETGEQGPQGETGEQGPIGPQGIQGEQGVQGESGIEGTNGINGEDGMDGQDGMSAYEIWLTIPGNEGKTESEFLDSLVGSVDSAVLDQLVMEIELLKLSNDILELKMWLSTLQEVFVSGEEFPDGDIPSLHYNSVITGADHTFDFYSDNGTFTITVTLGMYSEMLELSYTVVMNQMEIDAMNLQMAQEDAAEIQAWLDAMTDDYIHGDTLPPYPPVTNGSILSGVEGLVFNYFTQNGAVTIIVNKNGQVATASRTFTIGENFLQLLNSDAAYLQGWLNSLGDYADGDMLPTPPPLQNGSQIISGYPHEFSFGTDTVTLTIENGPYQTTVTRDFDVDPF